MRRRRGSVPLDELMFVTDTLDLYNSDDELEAGNWNTELHISPPSERRVVKLLVLGSEHVGKTKLVHCYAGKDREPQRSRGLSTVHVVKGSMIVELLVFSGTELYSTFADMTIKSVDGVLAVYDSTSIPSFLCAKTWLARVREKCSDDCVAALVANKMDLPKKETVSTEEGQLAAAQVWTMFVETSAVTGENVPFLFESVVRLALDGRPRMEGPPIEWSTFCGRQDSCSTVPFGRTWLANQCVLL